MGKMDSSKGIPLRTGGVMPKGADAADTKGERKEALRGGVAMGKEDMIGKDGEFNTGRTLVFAMSISVQLMQWKIKYEEVIKAKTPIRDLTRGSLTKLVIGELDGCSKE